MSPRSSGAPTRRILFVTHNFPRYTGDAAGSFVYQLAQSLLSAGAHVDVIAPAAPGVSGRALLNAIPVNRIRYAADAAQTLAYTGTMAEAVRGSWSGRRAFVGLLWAFRQAVREAVTSARREGRPYDLIHAHWWFPSGLVATLAGAGKGRMPPLCITMHGSDVRLARTVSVSHPVMRHVLGRARTVTAVSNWLATEANAIAPDTIVSVAPMPVDTSSFSPGSTTRNGRLLFVGRLNAQKGAADLISALALSTTDAHCDMVGDGPDRHALRDQANALGLRARVHWHGALPSDRLPDLYREASATAMPSREEGLGLVAVESQLCGTPVIAYGSGGLTDVVNPNHGGTLVPPGDIATLAKGIDRLLGDAKASALLGERGRAFVEQSFSPAAAAERYLGLYDQCVGGAGV